MNNFGKVSIILPVYNEEKKLAKCIESILNQSYIYWELIVINNGSTDNSENIIKKYANSDIRIKNIKTRKYIYFHACNAGLQSISGEYITFINSSDYCEKNFLETMIKNIKLYNADISICNFRENEKNIYYQRKNKIKEFTKNKVDILFEQRYFKTNILCKLYKASLFNELYFFERNAYADLEINFKLFKKAQKVVFDSMPLYNSQNALNQKFDRSKLDFINICDNIEKELKENGMKTKKLCQLRRYLYIITCDLLNKENNIKYQADLLMMKKYLAKNISNIMFDSYKFKYKINAIFLTR